MIGTLRGIFRVTMIVLWLIVSTAFATIFWALRLRYLQLRMVQLTEAGYAFCAGLRIHVTGEFAPDRPMLVVANHTSYLDVFVVGGLVPVAFTPKREIRGWPVIGFLAILGDCIFVERRPAEMHAAAAEMAKRLARGRALCIFPEGTTSDGVNIKPFKSGFFSLAFNHNMPVQPVSVAYTHIGKDPVTSERREEVAWVGAASFFVHFWHMLTLPPVHVEVVVHPLKRVGDFTDRKTLSRECEELIIRDVKRLTADAR